jgi:hypothetical protein
MWPDGGISLELRLKGGETDAFPEREKSTFLLFKRK